MLLNKLVY